MDLMSEGDVIAGTVWAQVAVAAKKIIAAANILRVARVARSTACCVLRARFPHDRGNPISKPQRSSPGVLHFSFLHHLGKRNQGEKSTKGVKDFL